MCCKRGGAEEEKEAAAEVWARTFDPLMGNLKWAAVANNNASTTDVDAYRSSAVKLSLDGMDRATSWLTIAKSGIRCLPYQKTAEYVAIRRDKRRGREYYN